jgi:spermidine dehydrogenase
VGRIEEAAKALGSTGIYSRVGRATDEEVLAGADQGSASTAQLIMPAPEGMGAAAFAERLRAAVPDLAAGALAIDLAGQSEFVSLIGREGRLGRVEVSAGNPAEAAIWADSARAALAGIATLSDVRDAFATTQPIIEIGLARQRIAEQGLTSAQKKDRLARISYEHYLLKVAKADPGVLPYYQHVTDGWWGCGIDAVSALDCWGTWFPGFQGLGLEPGEAPRMGFTPAGFAATGGSDTFHYPDGNASIARLLVRSLIPTALPGRDARDIVTAVADYTKLDRAESAARIRLNSTVLRVRNIGNDRVEVIYSRGGSLYRTTSRQCVLACWNHMVPYLCPELPEAQKTALHQLVKTPLVYVSVALRNWQAFQRLGVQRVDLPGGYFSSFELNEAVDIGGYKSVRSPDEPILVRMVRTPARYGLPEREQHKVGRAELLATPFETFERRIRDELGRALSSGGFDPARDIEGIAVNRWPHGYAPEYNFLVDGDTPPDKMPNVVGRQRFGRIAIANSDSGMGAYTDVAIEQAHRAVHELQRSVA